MSKLTPKQVELMYELFPGQSDVSTEWLLMPEIERKRCASCGNIHRCEKRQAGFYVNGVLVDEATYLEVSAKLRRIFEAGRDHLEVPIPRPVAPAV